MTSCSRGRFLLPALLKEGEEGSSAISFPDRVVAVQAVYRARMGWWRRSFGAKLGPNKDTALCVVLATPFCVKLGGGRACGKLERVRSCRSPGSGWIWRR